MNRRDRIEQARFAIAQALLAAAPEKIREDKLIEIGAAAAQNRLAPEFVKMALNEVILDRAGNVGPAINVAWDGGFELENWAYGV